MNNDELQHTVEQVSLTAFGIPFRNRAVFNPRLRTTGGRFAVATNDLDFNAKMFAVVDADTQIGIIKHELVHYHLYRAHRGYKHRDRDFKMLLAKVDGSRYAPQIEAPTQKHFWLYECERCKTQFRRRRRVNVGKYVCAACRGRLQLLGEGTGLNARRPFNERN